MWYFALGSVVLTPEISFMTLNQGRIREFFIRGEGQSLIQKTFVAANYLTTTTATATAKRT